jgi:cytochrome c oxidase cbb3-type subunit III
VRHLDSREKPKIAMERVVRLAKSRHELRHWLLPCLWVCALVALLQFRTQAQNPSGTYAQADIAYGARIYVAQCSACHGVNGEAVAGLNFRAGQLKRVSSDNDLRSIITGGIPGTAMPALKFDPAELAGIVAYLRNMGTLDAYAVKLGDPAHGQTIFEGSGHCASCHRVNGKGPRVAPDLSNIRAIRTPNLLERTLLDPNAAMLPVNRVVRAVTPDGKVITGRRLNEDTYSVQLIDEQEHLVSLVKADLREYTVIKISGMPSYKDTLNAKDVADVVAYLLSLKGSR